MHKERQTLQHKDSHTFSKVKEQLFFYKQWLYTLCFLCLSLIDWVRWSQTGWIWAFCVNLIGPLLCVLILSHFSFRRLSLIPYGIWLLLWSTATLLVFRLCRNAFPYGFVYQYFTGAFNIFCIGVVGIRMWQAHWKLSSITAFQKFLYGLWILLVICMTFSPNKENVWPLWFLCLFTIFYAVPYTETEKKQLWKGMAAGIILGFFVLQIYAYGFRPYDVVRYNGAFSNSNMTALFHLVVLAMFLYLLWDLELEQRKLRNLNQHLRPRQVVWKYFYLLMAGGQVSFAFYTIGRTAMALSVVILLAYGILSGCYAYPAPRILKVLRQWMILFGFVILTFPCVYLTIRYLPTVLHHPIWYEAEYSVDKVHSFDPSYSDKYVTFSEYYKAALGRFDLDKLQHLFVKAETDPPISSDGDKETDPTAAEMPDTSLERTADTGTTDSASDGLDEVVSNPETDELEADGMSVNEEAGSAVLVDSGSSAATDSIVEDPAKTAVLPAGSASDTNSIRREIFLLYWNGLNIKGHSLKDGYYQITPNFHAWHAQNLFLQIGYYYGIPAGILSILLVFALGIRALFCFFRNPFRPEGILPGLIWVVFVGYGTMECVWYPGQLILFLFFFLQKVEVPQAKLKRTRR
jgi:hypothetical protein